MHVLVPFSLRTWYNEGAKEAELQVSTKTKPPGSDGPWGFLAHYRPCSVVRLAALIEGGRPAIGKCSTLQHLL